MSRVREHTTGRDFALKALAAYYVAGGLWPVVWYRGFAFVTGPKRDDWLVKSFGLVLAGFGGAVALELRRGRRPVTVASSVAASLATVDAWYVLRGRIRPVYLLDAAVEVILLAGLLRRRGG